MLARPLLYVFGAMASYSEISTCHTARMLSLEYDGGGSRWFQTPPCSERHVQVSWGLIVVRR